MILANPSVVYKKKGNIVLLFNKFVLFVLGNIIVMSNTLLLCQIQ